MNCQWPALVKGARCIRCGRKLPADFRSPPASWCGSQPALVACRSRPIRSGWGDKLAARLIRHGISKQRYRRLKVRWGFADACNCGERQVKLNAVGRWVAKWRKRVADVVARLVAATRR
jgi:hypothetical protein